MPDFLDTGPGETGWTLLLAHGAGAGMETAFLERVTELISERGVRVVRFEFGYMAARRANGKRRPAPKAETLMPEYRLAVEEVHRSAPIGRLAIGGKSMGGRVASLVADELNGSAQISALVCLGYPFHPPGMPEKTRTEHLASLACPALIVQGERDPFGSRGEVGGYSLDPRIEIAWISDGDHDFGPRGASGFTRKGNLAVAADAVVAFLRRLDRHPAAAGQNEP
ncbi:MAG: alpha/beta family hydrolase [Hyphomicrobiaceae bacterium]